MRSGWPLLTASVSLAVSLSDVEQGIRVALVLVSLVHGLLALKRRGKARRVRKTKSRNENGGTQKAPPSLS